MFNEPQRCSLVMNMDFETFMYVAFFAILLQFPKFFLFARSARSTSAHNRQLMEEIFSFFFRFCEDKVIPFFYYSRFYEL